MRIYVNEKLKVAFFVSDINIDKAVQRDVAMLKWTTENECKLIISAQGIVSSSSHHSRSRNGNKDFGNEDSNYDDNNNNDTKSRSAPTPLTPLPADIYAVTSNEAAAKLIIKPSNDLTPLRVGTVTVFLLFC